MKTSRQKYDWHTLKLEFFVSDFLEVKAFFQDKYQTYTSHIKDKTIGWTREKQEFKRRIAEETIEEMKRKEVDLNSDFISTITAEIRSRDLNKASAKELETYWKLLRTMVGEVTSISSNRSQFEIKERENPDELTLEEREAIEQATNFILPSYWEDCKCGLKEPVKSFLR
jgi:hypothetical protein